MANTRQTVDGVECWTTDNNGIPLTEVGNNPSDIQAANAALLVDKGVGLCTDLAAAEALADSALQPGDETAEVADLNASADLAPAHNTQWLRSTGSVVLTINSDATQDPDYPDDMELVVEVASGTCTVVGENASSQPTINGSATATVSATAGLIFIKRVAANTWIVRKDQPALVPWTFSTYESAGIATGIKPNYKACPVTGTIVGYRITCNDASDMTIDLCVEDDGMLPAAGDKVTASAPLDTDGNAITESTTLTGWTVAVNEGDIGALNFLTSDAAAEFCEVQILIQPS